MSFAVFGVLFGLSIALYSLKLVHNVLSPDHAVLKRVFVGDEQQGNNNSSDTCSVLGDFCAPSFPKQTIVMVAIPHTASSSTEALFAATKTAWDTTRSLSSRGFSCDGQVTIRSDCPSQATRGLACVQDKLKYKGRQHNNYNAVSKFQRQVMFTTIRSPWTYVESQYRDRILFDQMWNAQFPTSLAVENVNVTEWSAQAWWRQNLFTKTLATDSRNIWGRMKLDANVIPSKNQSDHENQRGLDSEWLQLALERLESMPFFGLFHRLSETFELFGFHLCFPVDTNSYVWKQASKVEGPLSLVIEEYFALDLLLVDKAEVMFDKLVSDMREQKKRGILCNMNRSLKLPPGAEFGLECRSTNR